MSDADLNFYLYVRAEMKKRRVKLESMSVRADVEGDKAALLRRLDHEIDAIERRLAEGARHAA